MEQKEEKREESKEELLLDIEMRAKSDKRMMGYITASAKQKRK